MKTARIGLGLSATIWFVLLGGCTEATGPAQTASEQSVDPGVSAAKWSAEFTPSTLSQAEQLAELEWFREAARPFRGMEINVVSEALTTHEYESTTLAQAFYEITGVKVTHDLIQEGDVIEKLQTQMQSGENVYDAYVNDSDLIGTHARYGYVVPLSDFMAGEGADVTSPTLDLQDFIGISFTTGPDGKVYQLPDQQFANLYWFRYDWFSDPQLQAQFSALYGYELVCRSIGQPTRTLQNFSVSMCERLMASAFTDTWTMARKTPLWAGVLPMRGCPWRVLAIQDYRMVCPLMNGVFALKTVDR